MRGNDRAAQVAVKRLRAVAAHMPIERHLRQIVGHPALGNRSIEEAETLRQLWEDMDGGTALP